MSDKGKDCVPAVPGLQWFFAALQQQLGHPAADHSAALSLTAPLAVLLPGRSVPEPTHTSPVVSTIHVGSQTPQF